MRRLVKESEPIGKQALDSGMGPFIASTVLFGLFYTSWVVYQLIFAKHIIRHNSVGLYNAEYRYSLEYGLRWSPRQGLFKDGPIPPLVISKDRECTMYSGNQTCVQLTSVDFVLKQKRFIKDIVTLTLSPQQAVRIPLKYGWNINNVSPLRLVNRDSFPTCKFNGCMLEKRKFTLNAGMYEQAWFKQIFVTVGYTVNVTLINGNFTSNHSQLLVPLLDEYCSAQVLVSELGVL
ncbi:hypothetical protein DSO57_1009467 [Entomophthora muscae]|uniref:Uncharacterized protein n=1 Tax=Entomophthora muscae TaxID=34485 RepID=A0ACC2UGG2_9FUNG|nr:hypothetical protein DSO57_1009467 [Entomophthora muscae]